VKQLYQLVHLMPLDGVMKGEGHTVVNSAYKIAGKEYGGIVDVVAGGLPRDRQGYVTLEDLREAHLIEVSIFVLNDRKDTYSPFYGEFLDRSVVGVATSRDVEDYFRFIEGIFSTGWPEVRKDLI
jgi:hypothetical protein